MNALPTRVLLLSSPVLLMVPLLLVHGTIQADDLCEDHDEPIKGRVYGTDMFGNKD